MTTQLPKPTSIVFANTKSKVMMLARDMEAKAHSVSVIHGEMDKSERDYSLDEFKSGRSRVLITTDNLKLKVGIGMQAVSLVINYDMPSRMEDYMQRIDWCRASGAREDGVAINLITELDVDDMKTLEIEELPEDYFHIL